MATITQTQQARLDDMIREQGGAGNVLDKINRGSIGLSADWHDGAVEYLQGQAGNDGAPPAEPAGDGGTGDAAGVVSESAGDGGTGDAAGVVLESVGDGGTGDAAGVVSESAGDGGTGDAAGVVSESAGDGGTGDAAGVVSDTTDVSDAVPANAMTPTAASNELNSIMADGIHFDEYDRLRAMAADPHTSSLVLRVGEQEMTVGEYLAGLGIGSPDYSVTLNWEDDDGYNQSYTLTASGDIGFGGLNLIRKRIHWLTDPDDDTGELPALSPEQEQELAFLRRRLSEAGSANTDREWDRLAGLTVSDLQANPSLASPEHDDRTFSRLYSSRYLDSMLGKMAAGTITPEEAWQLNYTLAKMNAIDPGVRRLLEGLEEDRRGRSSKRLEARNQRNRNTAIAQIAMSSGLTFAEAEWLYKGANFTTSDDGTKQGNPDLVAAIIAARPPDAPAPAAAPTSAAPTSAAPTDRILLKVGGESLNHDQSVQYLRSTYGLSDAEITAMSAENSLNEFLADETNSPGFQAWAAEVADQAGISVAAVVQSFKQGDIPYERRGDNTLAFVADDAESLGWTPGALSAPQPYAVDNSDLEMAGWTPYSDAGGETRFVPPETQDWIVATADAAGLTPQQVYQSWRQGDIQQEGDDFGATAVQSASGQTFIIPAEAEGPDWRMGAAEQIAPGVFVVTTTRQVPLVTSAPGIDDESAVTNADILAGQQAKADAAYPAITADAASANEQLAAKQRESEEGVADKTFDMLALTGGATVGAAPLFAIGPDLLANAETLASENKDLFFEIERWRNQIDPETGKTPAEMWQEKYLTEGAVDQILDWVPGADLFPRGGMNLNEAFRDPASPGGAAITPTEAKMLLITAGGEQAMGTLEGSTVVLDFITLGGATKAIKNFALKPAYRNMSKEAIERFAKKWGAGFAREFVLEEQGLEKPVQIMGEVGATGDHTNLWDRGKVHYAGYNPSTGKYEPLGVYIDDAIEAAVWSFLETTRDVGDMTDTEASAAFQQHLNETGVSGLINERLGGGGTSTSASAGSQTVAVTETVAPATTTVVVPGETEATPPDAATAVASTVAAPVETTVAAPVETTVAAPVETTVAAPVETTVAAPDTTTDVAADTTTDVAADTTTDVAADTTTDVAADTTTDVAADTTTDVAADTTTDVAADTTTDVAADTTTDVAADTTTDVAADTTTDVAADTTTDVAADTAAQTAATPTANVATASGLSGGTQGIGPGPGAASTTAPAAAPTGIAATTTTDVAADTTTDVAADTTTDVAADTTTDVAADTTTDVATVTTTGQEQEIDVSGGEETDDGGGKTDDSGGEETDDGEGTDTTAAVQAETSPETDPGRVMAGANANITPRVAIGQGGGIPGIGGVPYLGGRGRFFRGGRAVGGNIRVVEWVQPTQVTYDLDTNRITEKALGNPREVKVLERDLDQPIPEARYADVMEVVPAVTGDGVDVVPRLDPKITNSREVKGKGAFPGGVTLPAKNAREVAWTQLTKIRYDLDTDEILETPLTPPQGLQLLRTDDTPPATRRRRVDASEVYATPDYVSVRSRPNPKQSRASRPKNGPRNAGRGSGGGGKRPKSGGRRGGASKMVKTWSGNPVAG